jgi:hypothetical protein
VTVMVCTLLAKPFSSAFQARNTLWWTLPSPAAMPTATMRLVIGEDLYRSPGGQLIGISMFAR